MKKTLLIFIFILISIGTSLFAQETVTVIQAKRSIRTQILLGLGFDVLFGTDVTQQKKSTSGDPNTFTDISKDDTSSNYEAGIVTDLYFLLGARILRSLDLYGKLGINYAFIYQELDIKTNEKKDNILYNRYDLSIDANARYTFPVSSSFGPYIGAGIGSSFNIVENIEWYKYSASKNRHTAIVLTNEKKGVKINLYTNLGLGFLFKTYENSAFSFGYNMRYYFSSIFNEDGEKTLKKRTGEQIKVNFGKNQLLHGINIEFSSTF